MPKTGASTGCLWPLEKAALEDPQNYSWIDDRFDYEESRVITLGRNKRSILVVVSTVRDHEEDGEEITRIISVREAVDIETDWYYLGRETW